MCFIKKAHGNRFRAHNKNYLPISRHVVDVPYQESLKLGSLFSRGYVEMGLRRSQEIALWVESGSGGQTSLV